MPNTYFLGMESPFTQWYFWVLAVVGSVGIGLLVFWLIRPKKTVIRSIDDPAIEAAILRLGGIANLLGADKDGARLKFTVKNVDQCDLAGLRDNGAMGVFVSGNVVKFMLTSDADRLISRIKEKKNEEIK